MCARAARRGRGFTLVEAILAIVIVGISLASVMAVFVVTTQHSADPMAQEQAQLIAESYLDEILLKKFYDPDTSNVCPAAAETRANFDNVCDYNGISEAPKDQYGSAIAGLSAFNVTVSVTHSGVTLGSIDNASVIRVLRVDVTVTGPGNTSIALSGYRTNYECDAAGNPECKPDT